MIDAGRLRDFGRVLGLTAALLHTPFPALGEQTESVSGQQLDMLPMARIPLPIGSHGQTMQMVVYLPHVYDAAHSYPLLVVPDADPLLGILKTIDFLWVEAGKSEPVILAGLPWGSTADAAWTNRSYYFLPDRVGLVEYYDQQLPVNNGGGAPELAAFLERQVLPAVFERYNVDRRRLGLAGFSMGGLFAAWHLVTHPGVFSDYLIVSPPLAAPFVGPEFARASEALRRRGFERPTRIYAAYAEDDIASVRSGAAAWIETWKGPNRIDNLDWRSEVVAGSRHDDGAVPALIDGYEFLYGK
jgi:predicted alpha/beta superfamily hydrolase